MHGIELLKKRNVLRYALTALRSNPSIMEFGASRDFGSTRLISDLALKTNSSVKLVDPNQKTLTNAKNSVKDELKLETFCSKGEDLEIEFFKDIGLFHLDGFDIVTSHPHKKTTLEDYRKNGIDLIKDGNVLSAESHLRISTKIVDASENNPCIIIFDDTWAYKGIWYGKGATAVPFLISQGFSLISKPSRNPFLFFKYKWGVALYRTY